MKVKEIIENEFLNFKKEYNLDTNLSYNMPKGYENAFGTFDIILDTLFLNLNKEFSKIRVLYFLS